MPVSNTLLVLDLNEGFNPDELQQWFSEWKDDGLLFLGFVEKFRWCDTEGQAIADKRLAFGPWEPSAIARLHEGVLNISQRQVRSEAHGEFMGNRFCPFRRRQVRGPKP